MSITPRSIEGRVLSYLKDQERNFWSENEEGEGKDRDAPEKHAEAILKEILLKVNQNIVCKDRYDNLKLWHNQFPLFDLENIIPDFCVSEELIKELSFSETLVISELDSNSVSTETTPKPVGALVISVLAMDAVLPENIKKKSVEDDLEQEVIQALQKAKQMAGAINVKSDVERIDLGQIEEQLQNTLTEYDKLLNAEMIANAKKFIVHVSSQFDDGFNGGSRITAWVDRKFHTLEEKRTEYVKEDDILNEKSLYVGLLRRKYYVRHTSSEGSLDDRKYYSLSKCQNLVCEGANFILMRYLAITRYRGEFELSTTYINGDLCQNLYECTGPFMGKVNNKDMEICKIYRYIIEKCGIGHMCVTVLTIHGRIVTQEWDGCNIIININPLQFVSREKPHTYDRKSLESTWYDDMELLSKYLDYKTEAELKMKVYMHDHPEIKNILADYLNNILLLKPQNILTFTMDFFQSLSPIKMARMGYFD